MIKKTALVIPFLFTAIISFAQNHEIDSLEKVLKLPAIHDTIKLNAYNNLAFDYAYIDPEKGLSYADASINLCQKLSNKVKLTTASNYKALNYATLGKDSLAIEWYNRSINLARSIGNQNGEAKALNNLAILYTNRSEYKKALELRLTALAIFQKLKNQKAIGGLYNNLGANYLYLASYPQALLYYFEALKTAQTLKDTTGQALALMNIGLVYKKLGNYPNTFKFYNSALQLFRNLDDKQRMAQILANMGSAYDERGEPIKALDLFNQALLINREIKSKREEGGNLTDIGIVYHNLKHYSKAYNALQQALILFNDMQDDNSLAVIYTELAELIMESPGAVLRESGINPTSRYNEAVKYATMGIDVAQKSNSAGREMAAWQILSTVHEKQRKFELALADHKKYTLLKDSIFNDDKKLAITRAEIQFEADKKQALAQAAIQREKLIKDALAVICVVILFAGVAIFVSYKKRRDATQAQKELAYLSKVNETEIKVLRLQMNPHFISNSLNSISNYISKNDNKKADYYLAKFAGLMRCILENAPEKEIRLADELQMTCLYMQLEAARLDGKFTYNVKLADNIDANNTMVPPLILQPFVENSIWHGIAPGPDTGHIQIDIKSEQQLLQIAVTDNGIGRQEKVPGKRSFGVKITRDRLALLNTEHYADVGIIFTNLQRGTRVDINLPYKVETDQ